MTDLETRIEVRDGQEFKVTVLPDVERPEPRRKADGRPRSRGARLEDPQTEQALLNRAAEGGQAAAEAQAMLDRIKAVKSARQHG